MKSLYKNRVAEKTQAVEYMDENGILWEASAKVLFNSQSEILGVRLEWLEGYNTADNVVLTLDHLIKGTLDNIEIHIGNKALEKLESVDFESEDK